MKKWLTLTIAIISLVLLLFPTMIAKHIPISPITHVSYYGTFTLTNLEEYLSSKGFNAIGATLYFWWIIWGGIIYSVLVEQWFGKKNNIEIKEELETKK